MSPHFMAKVCYILRAYLQEIAIELGQLGLDGIRDLGAVPHRLLGLHLAAHRLADQILHHVQLLVLEKGWIPGHNNTIRS